MRAFKADACAEGRKYDKIYGDRICESRILQPEVGGRVLPTELRATQIYCRLTADNKYNLAIYNRVSAKTKTKNVPSTSLYHWLDNGYVSKAATKNNTRVNID